MQHPSNKTSEYDAIIIGAGLFGLYSALLLTQNKKRVLIVEQDSEVCSRASKINQARIHLGYHYPRSVGTAQSSIDFYSRFTEEFKSCVNDSFDKVYAISSLNSKTLKTSFEKFCNFLSLPLEEVSTKKYFRPDTVDAAYLCKEASFDFHQIKNQILNELARTDLCQIRLKTKMIKQNISHENFELKLSDGDTVISGFVLNAAYSGLNQILRLFELPELKLKYELTEVVLGKPNFMMSKLGITMMDGPFFSAMPFGLTDYHSLTAVDYTPHRTSLGALPTFACQDSQVECRPEDLKPCDTCINKPQSAFPYMHQLFKNYMLGDYQFEYSHSMYTVKTILQESEIDDSRPTYISRAAGRPCFMSVFSGKINTIFEMQAALSGVFGELGQ